MNGVAVLGEKSRLRSLSGSNLLGEASQNWAFLVAPLVWTTRIV
jgi:hypothetical protein